MLSNAAIGLILKDCPNFYATQRILSVALFLLQEAHTSDRERVEREYGTELTSLINRMNNEAKK